MIQFRVEGTEENIGSLQKFPFYEYRKYVPGTENVFILH